MVKRDIRDYLQDMLTNIDIAQTLAEDLTFETFQADIRSVYAITHAVQIVGEAAKNIPIPLREQYPETPWKDLVGMRDKLAHVYFSTDLSIVWNTTQNSFPQLKPVVQAMLENEQSALEE